MNRNKRKCMSSSSSSSSASPSCRVYECVFRRKHVSLRPERVPPITGDRDILQQKHGKIWKQFGDSSWVVD